MLFGKKQEITHAETTVCAHAKINLTLDVTGRRADGYHTVCMVMQSVALHDEVRVTVTQGEKKPRGIILTCNLPYLPVDERNLAWRAADLFYQETGVLLGHLRNPYRKAHPDRRRAGWRFDRRGCGCCAR